MNRTVIELSCHNGLLRNWVLPWLVLWATNPWFCTPSQQYQHPLTLLFLPIHDSEITTKHRAQFHQLYATMECSLLTRPYLGYSCSTVVQYTIYTMIQEGEMLILHYIYCIITITHNTPDYEVYNAHEYQQPVSLLLQNKHQSHMSSSFHGKY